MTVSKGGALGNGGAANPSSLLDYSDLYTEFAYALAIEAPELWSWRFGPSLPSIDQFRRDLPEACLAVSVGVNGLEETTPFGIIAAHGADFRNQVVTVTGAVAASSRGRGAGKRLFGAFVSSVFERWNFRKIYMHVPSYEWRYDGEGDLAIEGRLREQCFRDGVWHDEIIVAIERQKVRSKEEK